MIQTTFALECPAYFLHEKRTDMSPQPYLGKAKPWLAVTKQLHMWCYSGVSEWKNTLGAKSHLQGQALPGLERGGA